MHTRQQQQTVLENCTDRQTTQMLTWTQKANMVLETTGPKMVE